MILPKYRMRSQLPTIFWQHQYYERTGNIFILAGQEELLEFEINSQVYSL